MKKCIVTLLTAATMVLCFKVNAFAADKPVPDQNDGTVELSADGSSADFEVNFDALGASSEGTIELDESAGATASLPKAQKNAITKLTNLGEYWGWFNTVGKPHKNGRVYLTLSNTSYVFGDIGVTTKGKYYFKGKKYSFAGFKSSLKDYSTAADRKAVLKSKANSTAKSLEKYASARSWKTQASEDYKKSKAYSTLVFNNLNYGFKVIITAARKSNKIALSYKFDKKSVKLKYIKDTLEKYKDKITAEPQPATPTYGTCLSSDIDMLEVSETVSGCNISESELIADTSISDNEIVLSDEPYGEYLELTTDFIQY